MINKIIYYLRLIIFPIYLLIVFMLIDYLYKPNFFSNLFFLINILYAFLIIITLLSKNNNFEKTLSYNILNIGIYGYIFMLFKIVSSSNSLDILNNQAYFKNNFIMMSILLIGLIIYTICLNNEENNLV